MENGRQVVEVRHRAPFVEHADDAQGMAFDAQVAAGAVGAAEQLLVERLADHRHARAGVVLAGGPGAAVAQRHVEHREEVGGGVARIDQLRRGAGLVGRDDDVAAGSQRLPQAALLLQQGFRIEAGQLALRFFAGAVAAHRFGIELHVEQAVALVRDRVAGQHVEHGQRRHRCADAQRDRQHHQRGQRLVAPEAAQGEVEVVAEHGGVLRRGWRRLRPARASRAPGRVRSTGRWPCRRRCARCAARAPRVPGRGSP